MQPTPQPTDEPRDDLREFLLAVRQSLLLIVSWIDKRYKVGRWAESGSASQGNTPTRQRS